MESPKEALVPVGRGRTEDLGSDGIKLKADRITEIFASLTEEPSIAENNKNIINGERKSISPCKTQPRSREEFYERVGTFRPGLWTVQEITPLECASWGWKLVEKDVVQCVTCHEVVCAALPDKIHKEAYVKFFDLLKNRLMTNHKEACGWLYNPCPLEFMEPLVISIQELRNMKNSVENLSALNSALPYLNNNRVTAVLGADDDIINGLVTNEDASEEVKVTAVLLILCGWSKGQGSYLRCNVCRRLVGLWSLFSIADELKKKEPNKDTDKPSRKRALSENVSDVDDDTDDNKRVTRQSPRKLKSQEVRDMPTPKRMRTRSRNEKMDTEEQSSPGKNEEKREYLLITSPTTQVEKVEKRYFSPLDEHRHWCPWITKIEETEEEDPLKGFCMVIDQIRSLLEMRDQRKSLTHGRYDKNVDGLRFVRNLLDEVTNE